MRASAGLPGRVTVRSSTIGPPTSCAPLGLDVRLEPVEHPVRHSDGAVLTAAGRPPGSGDRARRVGAAAHTLAADGLERPLVRFDPDVDGAAPACARSHRGAARDLPAPFLRSSSCPRRPRCTTPTASSRRCRRPCRSGCGCACGRTGDRGWRRRLRRCAVGRAVGHPRLPRALRRPRAAAQRVVAEPVARRCARRVLDAGPCVGRLDIDGRRTMGMSHNVIARCRRARPTAG